MRTIVTAALRRTRKAWSDPRTAWESIEYTYVNRARWWLWRNLRSVGGLFAKRWLKQHDVVDAINAYNRKRTASAFEPEWNDLWHLYSDVRKYKPKALLEYGSGQSTLVLAKAVADNGVGHLTTLESDEYWAEMNSKAIPDDLRPFVTIIHSPSRILSRLEIRFSHAPVPAPDFVYLDGPDHPEHSMASLDLLDLEPNFPLNFRLVIDGRTFNKNQLLRRFKRRYRSRWRGLASNDTIITLRE